MQRHRTAANNGGDGRTGRWQRAAEPAPVGDAAEATSEQRRDGSAGGMVVPMVSSGYYKNKRKNYEIMYITNVCTAICKIIMGYYLQ